MSEIKRYSNKIYFLKKYYLYTYNNNNNNCNVFEKKLIQPTVLLFTNDKINYYKLGTI